MSTTVRLKEALKKSDYLRKSVKKAKISREYHLDSSFMKSHYGESDTSYKCIEYEVLLLVHSLEKGMCSRELRPFGKEKCRELMHSLTLLIDARRSESSACMMGVAILQKWVAVYEENGWRDDPFDEVARFLESCDVNTCGVTCGSRSWSYKDATEFSSLDYLRAIESRHSVREFSDVPLRDEDVCSCIEAARLTPTACNRQMCRISWIKNQVLEAELESKIMGLGGFDKTGLNLFVITFDVAALTFFGERNQGYFNAGLVSMNFANALHFRGIGSCFLQWGNAFADERSIAEKLGLDPDERIAAVLGAGYYRKDTLIPCSNRKKPTELFRVVQ